jgi:NAD-dependent DNA ligase
MSQILPPTACPSCEGDVTWVNDLIYCLNKMCPAQWSKKLEHFGKLLKIKGFGPSCISKLDIGDYPELYELTVEDISLRLGSERLVGQLLKNYVRLYLRLKIYLRKVVLKQALAQKQQAT